MNAFMDIAGAIIGVGYHFNKGVQIFLRLNGETLHNNAHRPDKVRFCVGAAKPGQRLACKEKRVAGRECKTPGDAVNGVILITIAVVRRTQQPRYTRIIHQQLISKTIDLISIHFTKLCILHRAVFLDTGTDARLVDMLNCLMLQMPPLRSHLQDIPRLSGLYISTLNMRNARAVIGFEPEANLCMTEYSWPGNYDQFCRVLDELVLHTTTPYISVETVRDQLKRECTFYPGAVPQTHALPVDLTLEEIEQIAVQQALQAENGNQKRAAERLGISRTTLWRMLQREAPNSAQKSGI